MRTTGENIAGRHLGHLIILMWFAVALPGCSVLRHLDFGGSDEKPFELRFFWQQGPVIGEEDPENPGFDRDGNKIPPPEVLATYAFPDIHAGIAWVNGDDPRITPTVNVELAEFKVPILRWFVVAVGAGSNEYHLYLGKRLTSILEITVGPMLVRRLDENSFEWGIQATIIKF